MHDDLAVNDVVTPSTVQAKLTAGHYIKYS